MLTAVSTLSVCATGLIEEASLVSNHCALITILYRASVPVLRVYHLSLTCLSPVYINVHPLYQRFHLRRQVPRVPERRQTSHHRTDEETESTADGSRDDDRDGIYG